MALYNEMFIFLELPRIGKWGIIFILSRLYASSIGSGEMDRILWIHSGNKKLAVQSFYKVVSCQIHNFFSWQ